VPVQTLFDYIEAGDSLDEFLDDFRAVTKDHAIKVLERMNSKEIEVEEYFKNALLTIELVPSTCWFSNLRTELDSKSWDIVRKQTYRQANYVCEVCGGRGKKWPVECHEIWNYDSQKHIQKLVGLIGLCPSCHEVKHIGLAGIRGRRSVAEKHLASVNGWTQEQVERYIKWAFMIWKQRSKYEWTLDLSWLEQLGIKVKPRR
jgi:5-methylcytosine-specific restriction endonuclease McrA